MKAAYIQGGPPKTYYVKTEHRAEPSALLSRGSYFFGIIMASHLTPTRGDCYPYKLK